MKFELNEFKRELTDEEIIEDIKRVAKELNTDYIAISTYKKYGKYSQTAIQGHFDTWKNALSLAGLRNERNSSELKFISDEKYYEDLQRVATQTGKKTVLYDDYKRLGSFSGEHIINRFGRWDNVLIAAGLEPTGLARHRIDKQSLFEEIERIWLLLGRQPTSTDIIKGGISKYSIYTYKRRFGGWRNALQAFVDYINEDENRIETNDSENELIWESAKTTNSKKESISSEQQIECTSTSKVHKTPRNINMKLRFKVLKRDNFKCCTCGASPAKDPSVELHVDHLIPWAKGGETEIDNLQTLCSKCNLGKSDIE
ncbi:MAG: HNH endonuclease [Anaerolineaceae bacterium]|jgi:5-methylcytosine-specific restriction endonuclease McrA